MAGEWLKKTSDFLARFPGLLTLIGIGLILLNFVLQLLPAWSIVGWVARVDLPGGKYVPNPETLSAWSARSGGLTPTPVCDIINA
jgi:hypothetical protein